MNHTARIVLEIFLLLVLSGLLIWVGYRWLQRSEEPKKLIWQWFFSAITLGILFGIVMPVLSRAIDQNNAFLAVPLVAAIAAIGLVLTIIWRHNVAGFFAGFFSSLYDGGNAEIEPHAMYSIARTKRNRGKYDEAIKELRRQLEGFPTDFEAQLMLASIQAENQYDLQAASLTVQRLCAQPGHPPKTIAYALNTLADWQMKYGQDRDAARETLEQIIERMPDTEMAALAAQRIAHLANTEYLLAQHEPKRVRLRPGVQNIGLLPPEQHPKAPEVDPAAQATEYAKHLAVHPLDTEVREKLAVLYADHYNRPDLAIDQLEQLIAYPGQPAKRVVHWLNLVADLQIRHAAEYEAVRQTVQRIVDLFPESTAAANARNRLDHLKLEIKGKEKGQTVKLGSYERDIGLKSSRLPNQL